MAAAAGRRRSRCHSRRIPCSSSGWPAAVQWDSFISPRRSRDDMLAEAALAGEVDLLVGVEEEHNR